MFGLDSARARRETRTRAGRVDDDAVLVICVLSNCRRYLTIRSATLRSFLLGCTRSVQRDITSLYKINTSSHSPKINAIALRATASALTLDRQRDAKTSRSDILHSPCVEARTCYRYGFRVESEKRKPLGRFLPPLVFTRSCCSVSGAFTPLANAREAHADQHA